MKKLLFFVVLALLMCSCEQIKPGFGILKLWQLDPGYMRYEVFKDEEFILDGFNHKEGFIEIELPLGQYDLYVEYTPTGRYMEKFTFTDITVPNDFPITIMPSPY